MLQQQIYSNQSIPQESAREALFRHFISKIQVNNDLNRQLVSFQANKKANFYSWFKFKEGFSMDLILYILKKLNKKPGKLLDPFSGAGAALFSSAAEGWEVVGIELLPVGIFAVKARLVAERINPKEFKQSFKKILNSNFGENYDERYSFKHIAITQGAFPEETERDLAGYLKLIDTSNYDEDTKLLFNFGCFCILEEISYTRKDGQYLRWDFRSNRGKNNTQFNKGKILSFREAITKKLTQISNDISGDNIAKQMDLIPETPINKTAIKKIKVIESSSLLELPTLESDTVDLVITSPPYCNRYDYTRTYALELAFLNSSNDEVKSLRQAMLSCTVENKEKVEQLKKFYGDKGTLRIFENINKVFNSSSALKEVLRILNNSKNNGEINNPNIPKMVKNYFYEMCFIIYELSRTLKTQGHIVMVNDNVRYVGEEVPVDLILSEFAESFGLNVDYIWVLPRGKGNSSQQMGKHGREETRKCVYVWRKN